MASTRYLIALAAVLAGTAVACTSTGDDPTGPSAAGAPVLGKHRGPGDAEPQGELRCFPLDYGTTKKKVGRAGGTIYVGRNSLTIPAGALTKDVDIKAVVPMDTVAAINFYPEGLQFTPGSQVRLKLDYNACPGARLVSKVIVHTDSLSNVLEVLPTDDNFFTGTVEATLQHFSRYAVDY